MSLSLDDEASLETTATYTDEQLNKMTKAELYELAQSLGIEGVNTSMLKAEMVAAILAAVN